MKTPNELFTIPAAAEKWIEMIEAPETKATPEQKATLASQIRAAAPKATATAQGITGRRMEFVAATNEIKRVMREVK